MKLKTIIIDDERFALEKLQKYVERIPFLSLEASCSGTTEALSYMGGKEIDLVITDIDMPDVNGIRFVESLSPRPYVVFITAYRDFAVDGFRLSAIDYLVKPYDLADFSRSMNKVLEQYKKDHFAQERGDSTGNSIFVKIEHRFVRLEIARIRYIKSFGEYLQIYVDDTTSPFTTLGSFSEIMKRLGSNFLQIHRSFAVNMDKIMKIEKNTVVMDGDTYIHISDTFRQDFFDYLQNRSIGKLPK